MKLSKNILAFETIIYRIVFPYFFLKNLYEIFTRLSVLSVHRDSLFYCLSLELAAERLSNRHRHKFQASVPIFEWSELFLNYTVLTIKYNALNGAFALLLNRDATLKNMPNSKGKMLLSYNYLHRKINVLTQS